MAKTINFNTVLCKHQSAKLSRQLRALQFYKIVQIYQRFDEEEDNDGEIGNGAFNVGTAGGPSSEDMKSKNEDNHADGEQTTTDETNESLQTKCLSWRFGKCRI